MKNKTKNTYTIKKEIDFYVYIKVEASSEEEAHEKANECTIRCPLHNNYVVEEVSFKDYVGDMSITLDKEEFLCPISDEYYDKSDAVLVTHKGETFEISEDAWYDLQYDKNEEYKLVNS
tara:strand:+ start:11468 stop:11824 length:357 start_codon:yes stop_codon:yes gene_type:complete